MICKPCRAARALQTEHPDWLELATVGRVLQSVLAAWDGLQVAIRRAILRWSGRKSNGLVDGKQLLKVRASTIRC